MKTLWQKEDELDKKILDFTVGNDREIDVNFIKQDILGTIGHVLGLYKSSVLSKKEVKSLIKKLLIVFEDNKKNKKLIKSIDEDVHSMLERILTDYLGDTGKKVHTARSRNDQIATDVYLWIRQESIGMHSQLIILSKLLMLSAEKHKDKIMLGMTHLQPAMPSSIGAWLAGYSTLFLDDCDVLISSYKQSQSCPLGSAAGYGIPSDLIKIDREYTSNILGFKRPLEPVTSVQGGRGKLESHILFSCTQIACTASRLARDLILYSNPQFDFVKIPKKFTTGSSIMPQKRNPDVLELTRSSIHVIQSCLQEVISISSSVTSGYHRDFQRLKYPLVRGVNLTKSILDILIYILPNIIFKKNKIEEACKDEIYATKRALELVLKGMTFRDAYSHVAKEANNNKLPKVSGEKLPNIDNGLTQIKARLNFQTNWNNNTKKHESLIEKNLLTSLDYI